MGRKIRINKAKEQLTEAEWDFLTDNYDSNDRSDQDRWWQIFMLKYDNKGNVEALWNLHRDTILIEHVKENPGTRPALFWQFDASEPRKRLGGTGTVASDVLNYAPSFS